MGGRGSTDTAPEHTPSVRLKRIQNGSIHGRTSLRMNGHAGSSRNVGRQPFNLHGRVRGFVSDREDVVQEDLDTETLRSQCALFTVDANVPAYLRLDALKGTTILVIDDPVLDKRSDLMVCTELVPFVNRYSRSDVTSTRSVGLSRLSGSSSVSRGSPQTTTTSG